jgi:hypothetical protein
MTTPSNSLERLNRLLTRQEEAGAEREVLMKRRDEIVRLADEDARLDLNEKEDAEWRSLTDQIATIDEGVNRRDEQIRTLAELTSTELPRVAGSSESAKRAAAADIFIGLRSIATPRSRPQDEEMPRRKLTIAEARSVASLDT